MSLVLGYASKDSAIIMSDGRAGENGSYSEYYNKTRKINDNIILGFVGIKEEIDIFLDHVNNNISDVKQTMMVDEFLEYIAYLMDDKETKENFHSTFLIAGRERTQKMVLAKIGHYTNHQLKAKVATGPIYDWIGGTVNMRTIQNIVNNKIDLSNVIQSFQGIICDVSEIDNAVNKNFYMISL